MSNAPAEPPHAVAPPSCTLRARESRPASTRQTAAPPDIQKRIIRARMHRDGSPGLLYFRVRIEQADPRLRPVRVDLPLCTTSRTEAAARACFLVYTLRALGVGVIGDFPTPWHTSGGRA